MSRLRNRMAYYVALEHFLRTSRRQTLTKDWIEGIRRWWKVWPAQAKSYRGRKESVTNAEDLIESANAALSFLYEGEIKVKRLREDLLINKGLWAVGEDNSALLMDREVRNKVVEELDKALEILSDGRSDIEYMRSGGLFQNLKRHVIPIDDATAIFWGRGIPSKVVEIVQDVDKAISGRLLRHLSSIVRRAGGEFDLPELEPSTVTLGKANIIFLDTDMNKGMRHRGRDPHHRKKFIEQLKIAERLLAQKGFKHIWYGKFFIKNSTEAPENHLGVHFGVGATYHRDRDYVTIYMDPTKYLYRLILHELGHRYYYKFMSAQDRANFDKWFGAVDPTSSYGGTVPSEDFAEVFADYVTGRGDLSRAQVDRLKAFFGKTEKISNAHIGIEC